MSCQICTRNGNDTIDIKLYTVNELLPLPLERYCTVDEFDPREFQFTVLEPPKGTRGKRKKQPVVNEVFAFDIETTAIDEICQSVLYIWQFQIGERLTVFGRTWEEFQFFMIKFRACIPSGAKAICYIFNASYEFSFLKGIYNFTSEEIFAIDRRKILYFQMYNNIEFRCAWLQTNMNLKQFTKKMGVKHQKLDDFDYNIPRYSWDALTVQELRYCQNDVLGLVEGIKNEMEKDGDTLLTIPYTSTGYVRREFKKAMKNAGFFYRWAWDFFPDPELYDVMRRAFRGGDTHGNVWYFNHILENVHSYDRSSSYPDVICNREFPVTPFQRVDVTDINRVKESMRRHHRAFLMRVKMTGVKLKLRQWGDPYLTEDKSQFIVNPVIDNGRIRSADSLETCITDIDLYIIEETYDIKTIDVLQCYKSTYGKLPQCMIDLTIEYYRKKTELKGVDPYNYGKSKALLNSIYGMTAQRPISVPIVYSNETKQFTYDFDTPEEKLFTDARKSYWLPYQYGIWVTALSRQELYWGIKTVACHADDNTGELSDFVYCDTDSVKFIGDADFTEYNNSHMKASLESGAYATDPKGVTHYMGVFEREADYSRFKHLGAKRYAGEVRGKLEVTIAGVSKRFGAEELEERGGLEALQKDFTFYKAGGLCAQYNDVPPVTEWTVDGHTIPITSNVYLYPSEYTVGSDKEFINLLRLSKEELAFCWKLVYNDITRAENTAEN